jgi:hypothetical protein
MEPTKGGTEVERQELAQPGRSLGGCAIAEPLALACGILKRLADEDRRVNSFLFFALEAQPRHHM